MRIRALSVLPGCRHENPAKENRASKQNKAENLFDKNGPEAGTQKLI